MDSDQPLTCVRCWHAPASRLLVVRWREETLRLLCTGCAAKDEAEAPGLPGFRGLTVLMVWPEHGTVTEWGVTLEGYGNEPFASAADEGDARLIAASFPRSRTAVVRREVGPWTPVPGEGKGND